MFFDARQVRFLLRLVNERPISRHAGAAARHLCEHYSVGVLIGNQVMYAEEHLRTAERLLRNNKLPVAPLHPGAGRAKLAEFGGLSEKSMSVAPHRGSIGVRCVGGCMLDGVPIATPDGCYLVVTPEVFQRIACERILLVENLEPFRQLEHYRWLDYQGRAVLCLYRGDSALSVGDALHALRTRTEPIWAFVDFDPAGLVIANGLPSDRLERFVLPEPEWLRSAADTQRGRQLFDKQEDRARPSLDRATHPLVTDAWSELKQLRSAVTQERMRAFPT